MIQTSLSSSPCASAELAQAALNALIDQAGQGGEVTILSMVVNDIDGVWIASAVVRVEIPAKTADEKAVNDEDIDRIRNEAALSRENSFIVPYYLLPHEPSIADRSIPADLENTDMSTSSPPAPEPEPPASENRDENADSAEPLKGEKEEFSGEASALADKVIHEFNSNEGASEPPPAKDNPASTQDVSRREEDKAPPHFDENEKRVKDEDAEAPPPAPETLPRAAPLSPPA